MLLLLIVLTAFVESVEAQTTELPLHFAVVFFGKYLMGDETTHPT